MNGRLNCKVWQVACLLDNTVHYEGVMLHCSCHGWTLSVAVRPHLFFWFPIVSGSQDEAAGAQMFYSLNSLDGVVKGLFRGLL